VLRLGRILNATADAPQPPDEISVGFGLFSPASGCNCLVSPSPVAQNAGAAITLVTAAPAVQLVVLKGVIQLFYLRACGLFVRGRVRVSTVSLTGLRPKRMASPVLGTQMSILRPRTAPPVSATTYSPL